VTNKPDSVKLLPAYPLAAAARLVGAHPKTFYAWFRGRTLKSENGRIRKSQPILSTQAAPGEPISFIDLVEAHVFLLIRRQYDIPLRNIRAASEYLASIKKNLTFLAHKDFYLDEHHLFLKKDDALISLSERGQLVDHDIVASGLKQLSYGADGFASEFYPKRGDQEQREFVVAPDRNFGRLSIARLGVSADVVAERFVGGEKIADIAKDFGATVDEVEGAIRWHDRLAA
jgi:uncharacterized protein (DUF433 family)